jgi:hypothetical protein
MRFSVRILLPDFARFLACQGDLGLRVGLTMRATQIFQQPRLVLFGQQVIDLLLGHAGFLQLLEQ